MLDEEELVSQKENGFGLLGEKFFAENAVNADRMSAVAEERKKSSFEARVRNVGENVVEEQLPILVIEASQAVGGQKLDEDL